MRHQFRIIHSFISLLSIFNLQAIEQVMSLDGAWQFTIDPQDRGISEKWYANDFNCSQWQEVITPHTWQVMAGYEDYYGIAWYHRTIRPNDVFDIYNIKLEFDAIYRDVQVWLNGQRVGAHLGSGWTPFSFLLDSQILNSPELIITLRVDNRHSEQALPYLNSFDWAADGGIIRSARLRFLPEVYIDRILVGSKVAPDLLQAEVDIQFELFMLKDMQNDGYLFISITDPAGKIILQKKHALGTLRQQYTIKNPHLWHFDTPELYKLQTFLIRDEQIIHAKKVSFGLRRVELKNGYYYLNNEPMRLMGLEWMPGSDPRYGMAESREYIHAVLADMKELNSIISRFHWQQDAAVFEFCDRKGMLLQEEIPTWGPRTELETLGDVQAQQMREMITAHFNHPSIYAWGLCNEIRGQEEAGYRFIRDGIEIAHALDPGRLLTYASNSLQQTPEKDASRYVDFIEWNDYYDSWFGGSLPDLEDNLQRINRAFPDKSLVISEYGLCECDPNNPVGDTRRIEILKTHTDVYRRTKWVAGAIFFDYNDYRTHIGDKGRGAFQQRVHGVVDLLNRRKPSWAALKAEMSPVKFINISQPEIIMDSVTVNVKIATRNLENDLPAYTLRNYNAIWIAYNRFDQPTECGRLLLPDLPPGILHESSTTWPAFPELKKVSVEIFRPTGYSVLKEVLVLY
jgi:beta-galactosidase